MRAWLESLRWETRLVAGEIAASPAWRKAGFFLLPYVGVLVGLDVAAHYGEVADAHLPAQFFLSQDHGFGEFLEYALTASVAVMLWLMWRRTAALPYLANAVLFAWLTADNAIEFHEAFGHWIAPMLPVPAGSPVRANDVGETLLFGAIGALWLGGLWSSLRAARPRAAIHALILAGCVAGAAFFGVIVDMAVVWGHHTLAVKEFETWLEDGGEFAMICLSFFLAVAIFDGEKRRGRAVAAEPSATPLETAPLSA